MSKRKQTSTSSAAADSDQSASRFTSRTRTVTRSTTSNTTSTEATATFATGTSPPSIVPLTNIVPEVPETKVPTGNYYDPAAAAAAAAAPPTLPDANMLGYMIGPPRVVTSVTTQRFLKYALRGFDEEKAYYDVVSIRTEITTDIKYITCIEQNPPEISASARLADPSMYASSVIPPTGAFTTELDPDVVLGGGGGGSRTGSPDHEEAYANMSSDGLGPDPHQTDPLNATNVLYFNCDGYQVPYSLVLPVNPDVGASSGSDN